MAELAFPSFGSNLKADEKEDNLEKPHGRAAAVFARALWRGGLNLVPGFCVTHTGKGVR